MLGRQYPLSGYIAFPPEQVAISKHAFHTVAFNSMAYVLSDHLSHCVSAPSPCLISPDSQLRIDTSKSIDALAPISVSTIPSVEILNVAFVPGIAVTEKSPK